MSSIQAYLLLESNQLITLTYIFYHNFSQYQEFRRDRKLKTLDTMTPQTKENEIKYSTTHV